NVFLQVPNYDTGKSQKPFTVDAFVKIETERLRYIRCNQSKLRVDNYIHLKDFFFHDEDITNTGQKCILPSTYIGSPIHMHEYIQDALIYVRSYGRPCLFITFTCNSQWDEITQLLLPNQQSRDHVQSWVYSIEWQKKRIASCSYSNTVEKQNPCRKIGQIISAEFPDPKKHMIHEPCGNLNPNCPCMKDGKCKYKYPRPLLNDTRTDTNGYSLYRRRSTTNGGFTTKINMKIYNKYESIEVNNTWVVPYSPILSKIMKDDLNVELCTSVSAVKYILKYIHKGSDQTMFAIQNKDEIENYQNGRYRNMSKTRITYKDDQHWDDAMCEANETKSPRQLRSFFTIILTSCNPSNPQYLWEYIKKA
ncbi:Helitron like N domain-containing protein, partial [Aphis craccivora]